MCLRSEEERARFWLAVWFLIKPIDGVKVLLYEAHLELAENDLKQAYELVWGATALISTILLHERLEDEEQARNLKAAEEVVEELKARYAGKWVAISGGRLIAIADTYEELAERMRGGVVDGRAIVMKVGEHEPGKVVRGWWAGFL